ncbi:hypothetical protein [Paenibacillus sp. 7523-1]|uniref:hypothetical protein n=1 Tax=Paenibacillus sp. 7523-1 TaxID=2022550 RepID=UPI000BA72383|nr:hypothetical protein [Paenibacillus sp. 7523-1]PAD30143.1 hypothetical protein CHH60_17465 [Paenibacillus sp. 7523-1]
MNIRNDLMRQLLCQITTIVAESQTIRKRQLLSEDPQALNSPALRIREVNTISGVFLFKVMPLSLNRCLIRNYYHLKNEYYLIVMITF